MSLKSLRTVLVRDLTAVRSEVEAYPNDGDLWTLPDGLPNSGGTLALHLAGNLEHFIGALLGGTGYVRDRDAEFGARDAPREEIIARIDAAIATLRSVLGTLDARRLEEPFPQSVGGTTLPTGLFLTHLATHLAYHLGQLDYHRRVVTRQREGVGAQSIAALATGGDG